MSDTEAQYARLLRRIPLFSELADEDLHEIAGAIREKRLDKGQILFQRGDPSRGFFIVASGQIKLAFSSPQGSEKIVEVLGPMQSFGEAVMFMGRPYPVYSEALMDSVVLHIGADVIEARLEQDGRLARKMLAGLSIRLHSLVQDVETYSLRSSVQRVVGYLLQQAHGDGDDEGEEALELELPVSKQVIASRLNLTPETLSRAFSELTKAGLITVHGKHVSLHDLSGLRDYGN